MDDCNLEQLSITPGSLSPSFHQDVLEYSSTLDSRVQSVALSLRARDAAASYSITGQGVEGKSVTLTEGVTSLIKVEVVADDGTTKKLYSLNLKRLSSSDASLSSLCAVGGYSLVPGFSHDVTSYECHVPSACQLLELSATAPDPKTVIALSSTPIPLNLGLTNIQVVSTAPDGNSKMMYSISVYRQEIPIIISTLAVLSSQLPRCSFCLSLVHIPYNTLSAGTAFKFCYECIRLLTRTNKENPIDGTPLTGDWLQYCTDVENKLSCTKVGPISPLTEPVCMSELTSKWMSKREGLKSEQTDICKSCSKKIPSQDIEIHELYICSSKYPPKSLEHNIQVQAWQKQLCSFLTDTESSEFISAAKQQEQLYLESLPTVYNDSYKYAAGSSPLATIQLAASLYASAVKTKPKSWEAHMGLGRVMEERFYAGDVFGLKVGTIAKSVEDEDDDEGVGAGVIKEAVESGKQEEFEGLCRQIGVGPDAPLALQLKAVEQEYQSLKESGKQSEAEYVQSLYGWKSKHSHRAGGSKVGFSDEGPLGKARIKYTDAVSIAPGEHGPRFRLGRLLLDLGDAESAIVHLQTALSAKPLHQETRFCLGIAWLRAGPVDLLKQAARLVIEGITQVLLTEADRECSSPLPAPLSPPSLHCDIFPCWHTSITLIRSCMDLSVYLSASPTPDAPSSETCLLWGSYLASRAMQRILSRKETYTSMMWSLLETHSLLLNSLIQSNAARDTVFMRCQQLTGLLSVCGLEASSSLADIKLKTSQQAAIMRPCSTQVLGMLGDAQLGKSDTDTDRQTALLSQAELSFRAALECIGKSFGNKEPPSFLEKQDWWVDRKKEEAAKLQSKSVSAGKSTIGLVKPAVGRGAGSVSSKTTTGVPRPGPKASTKVPIKPSAGATKPVPTQTKTTTNKQQQPVSKPGVKNVATLGQLKTTGSTAKPQATAPSHVTVIPTEPANEEIKIEEIPTAPINAKTYHPFLGLARVLSRQNNSDTLQETKSMYSQAIELCPGLHDAYIELADLLIKNSPLEAVDVYLKYPFPDTPTFDDAYLYGEIVRILLKEGQYDDVRLVPNMIHLGKIMGIGMLEKYVKILEDKFKTKALMQVYAGVHGKDVEDPGLVQFFRFKCWI
ncbi:hypothetical protein LOD99_14061 [Oopsacas minuta]|uniref:Cadherin-like beta-sandwich-like domain-containing protein n=1 Tax=Oopsacas minuta TaxID=111878 RepID=A0AAV7KKI3_9METZ|nr:hypothetical protein LOD99_14061 [Oopsacas minuta]